TTYTLRHQLVVDPRAAVNTSVYLVDRSYTLQKLFVYTSMPTDRVSSPAIICAPGYTKCTTYLGYIEPVTTLSNELIDAQPRRENTAKAFFKMSRSSFSSSFSRRSFRSSSSSGFSFPLPGNA